MRAEHPDNSNIIGGANGTLIGTVEFDFDAGARSLPDADRWSLCFGDGARHDSATGLPAAMSAASWCSFAEDRRTPKGVSELRSSC